MEERKFYNIRDHIENAIRKYPDNIAFKLKEKEGKKVKYINITYKKLQQDIFALGTAINNMVKGEKRVAIIGKNSYPWMLSYISTLYGNNIVVPLDKGLPNGEIKDLVQRSRANIIIFEDAYMDIAKEMKEENWGNLEQYICMQENDTFKNLEEVMEDGKKHLKNDKSIILISPLGSEPDNTEVLLRSCITRIRWMGRLRPDRIILLDTGICRNTKSICTLFQKEYEYIEVMTPSEFLMEFSSSKEEFISSEEL